MTADSDQTIHPVEASGKPRTRELASRYRHSDRLAAPEEVVSRVRGWLNDAEHESHGLVAEAADGIVTVADYRRSARPSTGAVGIWLDDLFTDPTMRGRGAGFRSPRRPLPR